MAYRAGDFVATTSVIRSNVKGQGSLDIKSWGIVSPSKSEVDGETVIHVLFAVDGIFEVWEVFERDLRGISIDGYSNLQDV